MPVTILIVAAVILFLLTDYKRGLEHEERIVDNLEDLRDKAPRDIFERI